MSITREKGIIYLVGSPRYLSNIDLYMIHRRGLMLVGMHELIDFDAWKRQCLFKEIILWLESINLVKDKMWFRYWPCKSYRELFKALEGERPSEPFQILTWSMNK